MLFRNMEINTERNKAKTVDSDCLQGARLGVMKPHRGMLLLTINTLVLFDFLKLDACIPLIKIKSIFKKYVYIFYYFFNIFIVLQLKQYSRENLALSSLCVSMKVSIRVEWS